MKKRHSITFRGKAARLAFEAITGKILPASVPDRLRKHLASDSTATANDGTTSELYRIAHGLAPDAETDLETVERWAFDVVNARTHCRTTVEPAFGNVEAPQ